MNRLLTARRSFLESLAGLGLKHQLAPETEAVLSNAMAHISARPRRALVVDDDEMVCRMMADALRDRGFEVLTANSAPEGLATLAEELGFIGGVVAARAFPISLPVSRMQPVRPLRYHAQRSERSTQYDPALIAQ